MTKIDKGIEGDLKDIMYSFNNLVNESNSKLCKEVRKCKPSWLITGANLAKDQEIRDEILGYWIMFIWEVIEKNNSYDKEYIRKFAKSASLFRDKYEKGKCLTEIRWLGKSAIYSKHVEDFIDNWLNNDSNREAMILSKFFGTYKPESKINYTDGELERICKFFEDYKARKELNNTESKSRKVLSEIFSLFETYGDETILILYVEWLFICNRRQDTDNSREKELFNALVETLCMFLTGPLYSRKNPNNRKCECG